MPTDTIVAVATPPGRGGIGVVRVSGPEASAIAARLGERGGGLQPRHATVTRLSLDGARAIDRAVLTFFPAPHSYTGEDVLEISAHGSPVLLAEIVDAAIRLGARVAERGEFTLRAFLNGRIDLIQAEAVRDLIDAATPRQARAAFDQLDGTLTERIAAIDQELVALVARLEASLDFPEEGYHFVEPDDVARHIEAVAGRVESLVRDGRAGRLLREGMTAAIVGRPNVGKSSLFNRLAGADRAIVATAPGTTRDVITERVDVNGLAVTLVDTAGLRDAEEEIEAEGVKRAKRSADSADVVVLVLDASEPLHDDDRAALERSARRPRVVAINKWDLPAAWSEDRAMNGNAAVRVSAKTGAGLDALRDALVSASGAELRESVAVTNVRHLRLLERAAAALRRARGAAVEGAYEELVLADLHEARAALEEVTGRRSADDLLREIFSLFCIGK